MSTAALMCVVIAAQSATTSRSFALKHDDPLGGNRDLIALGAANALAGLSGTFVVNGSPSKTAVVDAAGGRTQVAQLVTAGSVLVMLLFAAAVLQRLPDAALVAIVFVIGAKLIQLRTLLHICRLHKDAFLGAAATMLVVVLVGIEQGIVLGIGVSILAHIRRQYHPKDVVLTDGVGSVLDRYEITNRVGDDHLFATVYEAVAAYQREAGPWPRETMPGP